MNILRRINVVHNVRHLYFRPNLLAMPFSTNKPFNAADASYRYKTNISGTKLLSHESAIIAQHRPNIHIRSISNAIVTEPKNPEENTLSTRLRNQIDPYMKLVRLDRPIGMCDKKNRTIISNDPVGGFNNFIISVSFVLQVRCYCSGRADGALRWAQHPANCPTSKRSPYSPAVRW